MIRHRCRSCCVEPWCRLRPFCANVRWLCLRASTDLSRCIRADTLAALRATQQRISRNILSVEMRKKLETTRERFGDSNYKGRRKYVRRPTGLKIDKFKKLGPRAFADYASTSGERDLKHLFLRRRKKTVSILLRVPRGGYGRALAWLCGQAQDGFKSDIE